MQGRAVAGPLLRPSPLRHTPWKGGGEGVLSPTIITACRALQTASAATGAIFKSQIGDSSLTFAKPKQHAVLTGIGWTSETSASSCSTSPPLWGSNRSLPITVNLPRRSYRNTIAIRLVLDWEEGRERTGWRRSVQSPLVAGIRASGGLP